MKPKKSEYIPFYGLKYFHRYFSTVTKSTFEDERTAMYFQFYQFSVMSVFIIIAIKLIINAIS